MIFIVVKFETRPDWTRRWPGLVERAFKQAPREMPRAPASTPKILNHAVSGPMFWSG